MKKPLTIKQVDSYLEYMKDFERFIDEQSRFNTGVVLGLILGLVANMWTNIVYNDIIKDLPTPLKIGILIVITIFVLWLLYEFWKNIQQRKQFLQRIKKPKEILQVYKQQKMKAEEKIEQTKMNEAMIQLAHLKRASKKKTTDEQLEKIRSRVFEEFERKSK